MSVADVIVFTRCLQECIAHPFSKSELDDVDNKGRKEERVGEDDRLQE